MGIQGFRVSVLSKTVKIALAALVLTSTDAAAQMTGVSGAYLAGTNALKVHDYSEAAQYFERALAFDGANAKLLQNTVVANLSLGEVRAAVGPAKALAMVAPEGQIAGLVVIADMIERGDFHAAMSALRGDTYTLAPLMRDLLIGWMHEALGEQQAASAHFASMGTDEDAVGMFGKYHNALAHAVRGEFETAAQLISDGPNGLIRISGQSVEIYAEILAATGRREDAIVAINEELATGRQNPALNALRDKLVMGETVEFTALGNPSDGAADVFQTFASVVLGGKERDFALYYARLALHLRPEAETSLFIAAELLEEQEQYDLAVEALAQVPADSASHLRAEIARAKAMEAAGQVDVAIEILRQLEKENAENASVHTALGLIFRASKRFDECIDSYSSAIDLIQTPQRRDWYVYYSRAICHDRGDAWDSAEADFRTALERAPEQPLILNYLGYSMVEKGQSIDEAKGMIERAVAARPDSGFVTDSLGWVLYRLGEFEAAVPHMERAVELEPVDPIINDHLGDVLWMVGREREARFQWRRALSFEPEAEDALRIRRKLEVGLTVVLEEEQRSIEDTKEANGG